MMPLPLLFTLLAGFSVSCTTASQHPNGRIINNVGDLTSIVLSEKMLSITDNLNHSHIAASAHFAIEQLDAREPSVNPIRTACPLRDSALRSRCCSFLFSDHDRGFDFCMSGDESRLQSDWRLTPEQEAEQTRVLLAVINQPKRRHVGSLDKKRSLFLTAVRHVESIVAAQIPPEGDLAPALRAYESFAALVKKSIKGGNVLTRYNEVFHRWESCAIFGVEGAPSAKAVFYCADFKLVTGPVLGAKALFEQDSAVAARYVADRRTETLSVEESNRSDIGSTTRLECDRFEKTFELVEEPEEEFFVVEDVPPPSSFDLCGNDVSLVCYSVCCDSVYAMSVFCQTAGRTCY